MQSSLRIQPEAPRLDTGPVSLRERVEADLAPRLAGMRAAAESLADAATVARYRARNGRLQAQDGAGRGRKRTAASETGTAGRLVYAVGDVHGRYDLLCVLVGEIAGDLARSGDARRPLVVFCGDYVDRGPESALVLEALLWLRQRGPWEVQLLKGNHEEGLLGFLDAPETGGAWLHYGGDATLESYGVTAPDPRCAEAMAGARDVLLAAMPAAHLHLLQQMDVLAVIGDYAFVHAGVAPGTPLAGQREEDLLWIRSEFLEASRPCEKVVVHGHTWTSAEPTLLAHRIGLDTGAYETGVLTAVRLDGATRRVLQSREPADLVAHPSDFTQADWGVNLNLSVRRRASAA
jgi:serine/threonine protein phosphatase 1